MIFLDTCIWIELLSVRTPESAHEKRQTKVATNLLADILKEGKTIITCREQICELISAIEKVKMKTISRQRKANNMSGIGNLKEFRKLEEFDCVKELCEAVVEDIKHFADVKNIEYYNFDLILQRLKLADIHDCIYFDYCIENEIDFYTFDEDLRNLGTSEKLHIL